MKKPLTPQDYPAFLAGLKERILQARTSAARAVNRDLILLYWDIGRGIIEKQQKAGWGEAVVERLAADLRHEFPDMRGFSAANIWRIRQFYLEYSDAGFLREVVRVAKKGVLPFLAQLVPERDPSVSVGRDSEFLVQPARGLETAPRSTADTEFLAQPVRELVASIPWGHHVTLPASLAPESSRPSAIVPQDKDCGVSGCAASVHFGDSLSPKLPGGLALINADRTKALAGRATSVADTRLFELLPAHPIVTVANVIKLLNTTPQPKRSRLVEMGILVETTGRRYPIRRLALFGTWARGDAREDSAVDLPADVDPSIGMDFVELAEELERLRTQTSSATGATRKLSDIR